MGASDEFDNENDAPLPPHERTWRHPAEVSNSMRHEYALTAAPPPIGRRAAALVAFVSIVASATLMLVTVQKGVTEPVAEPAEITTTSVPPKSATRAGVVPVLHAFADLYVVPASEVTGPRPRFSGTDGVVFETEPVTTIRQKGVAIVRNLSTAVNLLPYGAYGFATPKDARSIVAIDRSGTRFNVHHGIDSGIMSNASSTSLPGDWFPLDVDGVIDGVAALYADDRVYAIAVRHNHMHYGIMLSDLARLVTDAIAARNG